MRLTHLEMKGFKSFADKQVIHFDNDVIAIMGSNGCGKSNIVDAMRWVLGEQKTKTLRLEKMDNIIFNGTKDRKAANVAQVSLTFDNTKNIIPTEFSTVTITRALYRSGDSDYQINGVSCRLKDIRDLFLDTGIGSSTYAIMELKMIDNILNDIDNSRRTLIEQAAGVSKYKIRKHETLLKLKSTSADLERVQDLLYEIDGNLKSLESQARKANRFKKIKETYKELSVTLAKYDILSINKEYEALQKDLHAANDKKLALTASLKKLDAAIEEQKMSILEKEKALSGEQKKLNDFINSIQEKESDKKVTQQRLEFANNKVSSLQQQIIEQNAEEKQLKESLQNLEQKIETEKKALVNIKKTTDEARQKLEIKRAENLTVKDSLDQQRSKFQSVNQNKNEAEKQSAILEAKLENLKSSIQKSLFEKEERLDALNKLAEQKEKINVSIEKQKALLKSIEEKEAANNISIEKLEKSLDKSQTTTIADKRNLDAKQNEFKLTKSMVDSLEGFPAAIKFLKKKANWLSKTPLLSDILYCDEQYRVAIEIALKPYLNHFIVQTEKEAIDAIELLKQNDKGRASFFILDQFAAIKKVKTTKPILENSTAAIEILDIDNSYKPLLEYLLKDVFILRSNDLQTATAIEQGSYVALDGSAIKSTAELEGGKVGLFEGKRLGRLKQLEQLEKTITKLKDKVQVSENEYKENKKALEKLKSNSFKSTIDREKIVLQKMERERFGYESRIENFQDFVNEHSKKHDEVVRTIQIIENELKQVHKTLKKAHKESDIFQLKLEALESDFKAASLEFNALQTQFNEQNILFIQNENAVQSYEQTLNFKQSRLAELSHTKEKNTTEIEEAKISIEGLTKEVTTTENLLIALYKERDEKKKALSSHETNYYEWKEDVEKKEQDAKKQFNAKTEIDAEINRCNEKKNTLKFELQSLKQRLELEFKIDVNDLLDNLEEPEENRAEIELKLSKTANKIENFGDVNPMAEAAYDEMKKRFDFITGQKTDLEDAKESLLKTIDEIELTAQEHFMDAFVAIKENFKNVFRSMFNEHDTCDLILLNPDEPLESNIDIIAKPKGKRPQSINQLSGGEKSLTALSLLFALYLYKPAPFCILDEVDAPLDLANVEKFNKVIRRFSKQSQFIVVSHQEETGAAADVVHGVTMHKTGISTLVSTDFRNIGAEKTVA